MVTRLASTDTTARSESLISVCGGKAAGLWLPGGRVLLAGIALPRQHAAAQQGAADDRAGEERMPAAHQNAVV